MRPISTFAPRVDVSTGYGFGSALRLLLRRHEAVRLATPAAIRFNADHGIVVQHHDDDLDAVCVWAKALGLPVPRLGGGRVLTSAPLFRRSFGTEGVCFRIAVEVWCVSHDSVRSIRTDTEDRKWA
jgi:hypothetical protein